MPKMFAASRLGSGRWSPMPGGFAPGGSIEAAADGNPIDVLETIAAVPAYAPSGAVGSVFTEFKHRVKAKQLVTAAQCIAKL